MQLAGFGAVAIQLALLALVIRTFDIESGAFFRVLTLACVGFVAHHLAPMQLRLPLFVLVSLAAIVAVLGPVNAAETTGFGLLLIGLAHLPVRFWLRIGLILSAGALFAAMRVSLIPTPVSNVVWPIFGAMFMFRLIIYLYDLHNRSAPFGPWRALAYFFMLPNVCFPLFPVVDYKTLWRTYYDDDDVQIYQSGVEWMFRGILQLLIYRWVYQHMIGPESVASSLDAARFLVTAYLMYLKISGSFHLIVGILHLFGFHLPRTNNKFFLSESFTDYWRRINIYWKDFLQKVLFNPIYFRVSRRMSATVSLILATLGAFFITWALHSYQWFWIRGKFPVVWQDIAFWSMMALILLGNMLYENKYGRQRSLKKVRHSIADETRLALRTIVTFVVVCMTWVVWSSETFGEFTMILSRLVCVDARSLAWILVSLVGLGIVAVIVARVERRKTAAALTRAKQRKIVAPIWWRAYHVAAACAVILIIAYAPLVIDIHPAISNTVDALKVSKLNPRDAQMLDRGYYEDLTNVVRFNTALGDLYNQRPPNWERCWAMRPVDGYPDFALMPNKRVWFKGAIMSTNRWGMRDREYSKDRPAGTYRIAILGASHPMGTGVGDDEVFDNVLEDRLNTEHAGDGRRYELLNFSVGGYGPLQLLADLDQRVMDFEFDALLCMGVDDLYWMMKDVADAAGHGFPVPYDYIQNVMREERLTEGVSYAEATQKLAPRQEELLRWFYSALVQRCRSRGAVPMVGYIPPTKGHLNTPEMNARIQRQMELARKAGLVVIDMTDAYAGADPSQIVIAPWDSHPNALGHRMIAEKLYEELTRQNLL